MKIIKLTLTIFFSTQIFSAQINLDEQLKKAVAEQDLELAKNAIEQGANILTGDLNNPILHVAIKTLNYEMVKLLLSKDSAAVGSYKNGITSIVLACELNNKEIVSLLLRSGATQFYPFKIVTLDDATLKKIAATENKMDELQNELQEMRNEFKEMREELRLACNEFNLPLVLQPMLPNIVRPARHLNDLQKDRVNQIYQLLKINQSEDNILLATIQGNKDLLKKLISNKMSEAELNKCDNTGITALMFACAMGNSVTVKLLVNYHKIYGDLDFGKRNTTNETALTLANGNKNILKIFSKLGAKIVAEINQAIPTIIKNNSWPNPLSKLIVHYIIGEVNLITPAVIPTVPANNNANNQGSCIVQ